MPLGQDHRSDIVSVWQNKMMPSVEVCEFWRYYQPKTVFAEANIWQSGSLIDFPSVAKLLCSFW